MEILVECPKEMGQQVANQLQICMEEAAKPYCPIIPLTATPVIGDYWGH